MKYFSLLIAALGVTQATMHVPSVKDHFFTDILLRDLLDRMGNEFADVADSYLDPQDIPRLVPSDFDKVKEIPVEMPLDYEGIEALNPKTSIRDHEYLQHSTLSSHQKLHNDNSPLANNRHRIQPNLKGMKDGKTQNQLPAYCTPPNPCPIGYTSQNHCIDNFENTATFSRNFQSAENCMCDTEHMFNCLNDVDEDRNNLQVMQIRNSDFQQIVERFQEENPYFQGEKLPIAAKKGINVIY